MVGVGDIIKVNDKMQSGYSYDLVAPVGEDFDEGFQPRFSQQRCWKWASLKVNIATIAPVNFRKTGMKTPKSARRRTLISTILASKAGNRSPYGRKGAGFTDQTHGAGSNGTAAIISDAE